MIENMDKGALQAAALGMTETAHLNGNVSPLRIGGEGLAKPPASGELDRYFSKVVFDDCKRPLVAPRWRVRDTVELGGLVFIGGQSTAGKSFVVMELARCLMTSEPFFGRGIDRPCGVVLFAPEGQSTIDARMAAMKSHHGIKEDLPFAYLGELPNIETPEGRALIAALLRKIDGVFQERFGLELGAVVMDTLAATFQLKDQNDSSEAAARIAQLREIQRAVSPDLTVIPVHHYGKTIEAGLTGGHGWKAGADQVLSVLARKDEITGECEARELAIAKNRNGSEGPLAPFTLEYKALGLREDGSEWGSLYLAPQLDQPSTFSARRAPKVAKHLATFDAAVLDAMITSGKPFRVAGGQGPTVKAVRLSPTVRELFHAKYPTGTDDPKKSAEQNESARYEAKKKAFQRAVQQMDPARYASETDASGDEWVWRVGDMRDMGDNSDA